MDRFFIKDLRKHAIPQWRLKYHISFAAKSTMYSVLAISIGNSVQFAYIHLNKFASYIASLDHLRDNSDTSLLISIWEVTEFLIFILISNWIRVLYFLQMQMNCLYEQC